MNALVVSFGWETAVDRDVVDRHHAIAGCSARMHLDSVSRSFPNKPRPGTARSRSKSPVAGTWGHRIVDELAPQPGEVVVTKHRSDAFVGTDLDLVLRAAGVATVVTTGIVTNGCVESTVRHAAFLDYYSVLVEDACASNSENLQQAAVSLLRGRHDVVTTAVVTQCWRNS